MRKVLFLFLATGLAAMMVGCQNKTAVVEEKAISDLELADVRPVEISPTVSVGTAGPVQPIHSATPTTPTVTTVVPPVPPEPDTVQVVRPAATGTPPMNYTVVKGDNLTRISRRFYGDDSMVKPIFTANARALKSPDLIKVGQVLYLPARGAASVRTVSHRPRPAAVARRMTPKTHKVKKGESLFLIAKRIYGKGSKWVKIYEANKAKLKNPDRVREGMVLTIPAI